MDKSKKVYMYAYIFSFLVLLGLFIIFIYNKISNERLKERKEIRVINTMIESGKYKETIRAIEEKNDNELSNEKKLSLLSAYLNYGNYFHKEEENSKKAIEILDTMEDDYSKFYYYGYALEIIKDYTGALDNYNKGLNLDGLTDSQKSLFKTQIGHVYDLKGEFDKVFAYYDEAYKLDQNNISALSNLGRYYVRTKDYTKAYELLNKALELTSNLPQKAEISFSLSSIELELNGLKPDIDKSIEYARKSIEYYPDYAMGYLALARGLYMKNNEANYLEIEENIKKTIELNPNSYYAYELSAMHEYDKGNFDKSYELFDKAEKTVDSDMILMDSSREKEKNIINYKMYIFYEINNKKGDINEVFKFFDKIKPINAGRSIMLQQVKRNKYGILNFLIDNKKMNNYIQEFSK